jgi:hypothetical protein
MQEGIQTVMVVGTVAGACVYGISLLVAIGNNRQDNAKLKAVVQETVQITVQPEEPPETMYRARPSIERSERSA